MVNERHRNKGAPPTNSIKEGIINLKVKCTPKEDDAM
jgi:hypothetical protein